MGPVVAVVGVVFRAEAGADLGHVVSVRVVVVSVLFLVEEAHALRDVRVVVVSVFWWILGLRDMRGRDLPGCAVSKFSYVRCACFCTNSSCASILALLMD